MKLKLSFLAIILAVFSFAQSAPSYYSGINFTKTKNELKNELATLITDTHTQTISYSAGLADLFKTSDADPDNPSNLLLIYGSQASGTHQRSRAYTGTWNREHVYAKSKGTPNLGTSGPGADGHHLRPADNTLNSTRGSLLFDDGSGAMAYTTSRGGWFPGDEWKGDVARIIMYMYVRYKNQCLPLNITMNPATYSSDFPDILLKWNVEDPVSNFERNRNNVVYNIQHNRNPFIDNPYLATVIWGGPNAQNTWPDTFTGGSGSNNDTEAPTAPANLAVTGKTSTSIVLAWSASTDNVGVSSYDVYVDQVYHSTVYTPGTTISGLSPSTTYNFYIVAKDYAGNKSTNSNTVAGTTEATGGTGDTGGTGSGTSCGTEDFETIPTGGSSPDSSYAGRTWTNKNIVWTATNARVDTQIYIDGSNNKAICIKNGSLKSSTISGGIGSLTVKTYLPFSDAAGSYTLKVNGVVKGQIPYSKTATTQVINDINVSGNVIIELIDTTTNRVSFDNLTWTCYAAMATDDVNLNNTKLSVYPNPVKNNEFYINGITKKEKVQIYDLNGKLVQTINNVSNKEKLKLTNLPKGAYIVKTESKSTKIIVE